jgi:hypothetical protein
LGFNSFLTKNNCFDTLIDENPEAVKLYGGGDTMQELKRHMPGLYIKAMDIQNVSSLPVVVLF